MERHDLPAFPGAGVVQHNHHEAGFEERLKRSGRQTLMGALLIPPTILVSAVGIENRHFISGLVGYALHEDPEDGDMVLHFNDCAIDPEGLVGKVEENPNTDTEPAPGYSELADPILQAVATNRSASSNLPVFDTDGFDRRQQMFSPFGSGYFDRRVTSFVASFGAPFEIRGNNEDRSFQFDQTAFERLTSTILNPEIYKYPYVSEYVNCRQKAIVLEREYEDMQTGVFIIAEPNKGLQLNNVVTFSEERRRSHSFGLGIADVETSWFGMEVLPEGVIIVPGSTKGGTTDLTYQLNLRFAEELLQYLLSGKDLHDIARERDKLERITDYAWMSIEAYFEERGGLPLVIIPTE